MRRLHWGLLLGMTATVASAVGAQGAPVALQRSLTTGSAPAGWELTAPPALASLTSAADTPRAPWWAPIASGALPGAGQFALKQQRSVAYLVAEAFLVVQYLAARRDGNRERDAYRALAVSVARKPFGGTQPGTWDYYERMEQFLESGAFDRVPGGSVDPETDPTTYNGFRWQLARETYWLNPDVPPAPGSGEYQRALDFYQRNAVGDAFRWSWRDAQLQQDVYVQTIRGANRSYQRAVNMLGVVAVNHLTSLIDAYISVRVRRFGGAGVGVAGYAVDGVHAAYQPISDSNGRWQAGVRLAPR